MTQDTRPQRFLSAQQAREYVGMTRSTFGRKAPRPDAQFGHKYAYRGYLEESLEAMKAGQDVSDAGPAEPLRALALTDAARHLGITPAAFLRRGVHPPDVLIGEIPGWIAENLDAADEEFNSTPGPKGSRRNNA